MRSKKSAICSVRPVILCLFIITSLFLANIGNAQSPVEERKSIIDKISSGLIPRIQVQNDPRYFDLMERMIHYGVPGFSIATIENGVMTNAKGFGYGRKAAGIKVDEETVFQAGSISKSVTAILTLKLYEQGILDIDADISDYLRTWKMPESRFLIGNKVTLRMLLSHTSGLKGFQRMKLDEIGYHTNEIAPTLNEVLDGETYIQKVALDTFPGVRHKYSNQGYSLVQKVLEDITNEPFHVLADRIVLKPFDMSNSTFEAIIPSDTNATYAYAYRYGEPKSGFWRNTTSKCSGGLNSTPSDLAKFIIKVSNIIGGRDSFLQEAVAKLILEGEGYGLGFEFYNKGNTNLISHSGRNAGFFAYMAIDRETNNGFVMMTNSDDANDLFAEVLRGTANVFEWDFAHPKYIETIEIDRADYSDYIGDYVYRDEEEQETLRVIEKNGELIYFTVDEDEPVEYPLGAISKRTLIDMVDGNTLKFTRKRGKFFKLVYDGEYEYFRSRR